jgi:hypothetical protein
MTKEERLLNEGLDFNMLFVLQNPDTLNSNLRVSGWKELCKRKGYLTLGGDLTDKGLEIVELFSDGLTINNAGELKPIEEVKEKVKKDTSFKDWVEILYEKIKERLFKETATKSPNIVVDGRAYPYMCSKVDLEQKIKTFISKYGMKDLKIIEALLLRHCSIRNQKIISYIIKQGANAKSDLAGDYENYVEEIPKDEGIIKKENIF